MILGTTAVATVVSLLGGCPLSVRQPAVLTPEAASASWTLSPRLMPPSQPLMTPGGTLAMPNANASALDAACLTPADTGRPSARPRAITYSDSYYTRLTIHRIGSYAMLPLFVTEYILGQKLINDTTPGSGLKAAHGLVAGGIGLVFATNTVTGVWNWVDSRHDPSDHTLRNVHSAIMLASDIGFLWTATSTPGGIRHTPPNVRQQQARRHRAIAITSISVSAVGAAMMWIWKH